MKMPPFRNMELIEIEELEAGDEIIISCQSYFKYLRVINKPVIGKKTHWKTGKPLYNSVKCSTRKEIETTTWTRGNGEIMTRNYIVWKVTPEDHNSVQYLDLQSRQLLLVRKNGE